MIKRGEIEVSPPYKLSLPQPSNDVKKDLWININFHYKIRKTSLTTAT
jgi:hypothetical protein